MLTDTETFRFPLDVTRRATTGEHPTVARLRPDQVARGRRAFEVEFARAATAWDAGGTADAMRVLRRPVARSTTVAVLGPLSSAERDRVADLVLAWVDALAPIIAATRPPLRWSRTRRLERAARAELERALEDLGVDRPTVVAVELAAGVQVPVAAGAWLLVLLAEHPHEATTARLHGSAVEVAWETLRLRPPTWLTARMTTGPASFEHGTLPAHAVVLASPLLLGRCADLLPEGPAPVERFDPQRWVAGNVRPGAWLPFGAGPHACPGRSLGLAQLTALARWAADRQVVLTQPARIDQTRGIFPSPALLRCGAVPSSPEE